MYNAHEITHTDNAHRANAETHLRTDTGDVETTYVLYAVLSLSTLFVHISEMELEPPRTQCVPTPEIRFSTVKLGLKTQREGYFPKYAHHPSLNVVLSESKRLFTLLNWLQWR
ncbi:hypothetical protein Tsp_11649 [Trichinella spiralis]|uniref:hypothetical protein n=1 Tax=Trichinella spiralis TaxID=6334 RepID=UPI0001EFE187|nr:hypothetical protein Tsp_11649 [Trichinella spiralis]